MMFTTHELGTAFQKPITNLQALILFLKKNKTKKPYNLLHFETDTLVVQGHAKFSSYR